MMECYNLSYFFNVITVISAGQLSRMGRVQPSPELMYKA